MNTKNLRPFTKNMTNSQREILSIAWFSEFGITKPNDKSMATVADLTERELEIAEALSRGLSSDEISAKLFISVFTVNTHRRNAMVKVNAKNTAHLVRKCFEGGVFDTGIHLALVS